MIVTGRNGEGKQSSLKSTILFIIAGSIMIAHGLRMMMQGIFHPESIYPAPLPTSIDFWFDWFILSILGAGILFIGARRWLAWYRKQKQEKNDGHFDKQGFFSST